MINDLYVHPDMVAKITVGTSAYCWGMTATATRPAGPGTEDLSGVARSEATLRTFLHGLPGVDEVGAQARAAMLGTRSIKTSSKAWAIDQAIGMIDLTTLEGADTPGKVRALSTKALRPDPEDPSCPRVAAVCVYPAMVPVAAPILAGTGVHLASVATAFPSGQAPLPVKLEDTRAAVAAGADEIDMVINRGAFLSGRYLEVFDEIAAVKEGWQGSWPWSDEDRTVLKAIDELIDTNDLSDETWNALTAFYDRRQMMDFVHTIGHYVMLAWAINAMRMPLNVPPRATSTLRWIAGQRLAGLVDFNSDVADPSPFSEKPGGDVALVPGSGRVSLWTGGPRP